MNRFDPFPKSLSLLFLCLCCGSSGLFASLSAVETWPQFRGTSGAAVAQGQRVPVNLGKETLRWSAKLPGPGSSSPVVWGNKIFVTSGLFEEGRVELTCLDALSGSRNWSVSVGTGAYQTHQFNNLASGTPCLTERLVIFGWYDSSSKHGMLSAYTHDGDSVWTVDLGQFDSQHGVSFNLVAHKDRVIVPNLHMGGGYIGAFSLDDGRALWKVSNPIKAKTSYIAPLIRKRLENGDLEVVIAGELIGMLGLDFETGETNWSLPEAFNHRTITSPTIVWEDADTGEVLIAAGCKEGTYFAARMPQFKDGELVSEAHKKWSMESRAPYVPTPVSDGKTLYALHDGGTLTALDGPSGAVRWQGKLRGNFYSSPVLIDGKLYCQSRDGEMWVVEAGDAFNVIRQSSLNPPEDVTWCDATPAVAHNRLYVRLGSRLDCY